MALHSRRAVAASSRWRRRVLAASGAAALLCIFGLLMPSSSSDVTAAPPQSQPIVQPQTEGAASPATPAPVPWTAQPPTVAAVGALSGAVGVQQQRTAASTQSATEAPSSEAPEPVAPARSRDPSKPPRVGVCIVGGIRSLSVTWENLWANGIEALQPDPAYRHVLFETMLADDCDANQYNTRHVVEACRQQLANSTAFLRGNNVTNHPTRRFDLHVDDTLTNCSHPYASRHQCCKEYPQAMDPSVHVRVAGIGQYLRKAQCSERLLKIERDTGVAFDMVMWIRPDLFVFDQLPSADQVLRSRYPRVLVSSKEKGQPVGDYIFVAPGSLFARWHRALVDVLGPKCRESRAVIPEAKLDAYRKAKKIPTQIYPFVFAIARSDELADCGRLDNEVLASVSMVDEVTGDTVNPFDLCRRRFPQRDRVNAPLALPPPAGRPGAGAPRPAPGADGGLSAAEVVQQLRAQQAAEQNAQFAGAVRRRSKVRAGVPEDDDGDNHDDHNHHRHRDPDADDHRAPRHGGAHDDDHHHHRDDEERARRRVHSDRHHDHGRRHHDHDHDDDDHHSSRDDHHDRRQDNPDHRRLIRQRMEEHRRVMRQRQADFFARDA